VQLVHEKLMLVRKNMGAHNSYSFFRSTLDLLEATDATGTWAQECALVDLYNNCNGPGWTRNNKWCTGASLDSWEGVREGADGSVVQLLLSHNNLKGKHVWIHNTQSKCMCGVGVIPESAKLW
jgi:hypothetical protein